MLHSDASVAVDVATIFSFFLLFNRPHLIIIGITLIETSLTEHINLRARKTEREHRYNGTDCHCSSTNELFDWLKFNSFIDKAANLF